MRKLVIGVAATVIGVVALAAPASAHVTVNPNSATKGGYTKLTFRVPNEEDNASTTKLEVTVPTDHPIANVSVQPKPGWTYTVDKTTLATPIKTDDGEVTEAVSKITWAGGNIKPGEFDEFNVSAGPLPEDVDSVTFKAVQTYSNGDVVRWIDEGDHDSAEHPAPVLALTAANASTTATTAASTSHTESDDSSNALAVVALIVGGLGLIVAIVALTSRRKTA